MMFFYLSPNLLNMYFVFFILLPGLILLRCRIYGHCLCRRVSRRLILGLLARSCSILALIFGFIRVIISMSKMQHVYFY